MDNTQKVGQFGQFVGQKRARKPNRTIEQKLADLERQRQELQNRQAIEEKATDSKFAPFVEALNALSAQLGRNALELSETNCVTGIPFKIRLCNAKANMLQAKLAFAEHVETAGRSTQYALRNALDKLLRDNASAEDINSAYLEIAQDSSETFELAEKVEKATQAYHSVQSERPISDPSNPKKRGRKPKTQSAN